MDEWYRNRRTGEQTTARGKYINLVSTLQEIVREQLRNLQGDRKKNRMKERKARVVQQKMV